MARPVVAVALAVLGLVFALPAVAQALPPVCEGADLVTRPGVVLDLPAPSCTNLTAPPVPMVVKAPAHGMLTQGTPSTYTPAAGFHGEDEFTYSVTDPVNGPSDAAKVTVLVDTEPTCRSGVATVVADTPLLIEDLDCSDADGDFLNVYVDDPAHGTIAFPNGSVLYTPAAGYLGPDSFSYYAFDPFGLDSADATLTLNVVPRPAPVATIRPTPVPKDLTAPALALKNASKKQALAVTMTMSESASATLTVALDKATARKLKLSQKVGTLKATLKAGTSTLKVKLSAKAAKAFKKLKSVKLTVTVVVADAAGNKTTKTLKVTLKK